MEVVQGPNKEPVKTTEEKQQGFKFSYQAFNKEKMGFFWGAVQKVYTTKTFPGFKSAYRIKRLCEAVQQEMKRFNELAKEVQDTHKGNQEEIDKKMEELWAMEVDIKWNPLSEQELEAIQNISPADIEGLTFIADPKCFQ